MSKDDVFEFGYTMDLNMELPKMTKDEFIKKTRSMLQHIIDEYRDNWKDKYDSPSDELIFDSESFTDFIENAIIFGEDEPFLELLHCQIID